MNRYLLSVLAGVLTSITCFSAHAWSAQGHRMVGAVAETRLTPEARAQVSYLLEGEATPTLAGVAAWADELRRLDPELGKRSAAWHYINMGEDNCKYSPARHCKQGNCVIAAVSDQLALLANVSLPRQERAQALKFVVHFVGDLHQPMHAGYAHDLGGNTYQLQYNNRGTNLHALWDGGMFYPLKRSDDAFLQHLLSLPAPVTDDAALPMTDRVVEWTSQTCRLAIRPGVYPKTRKIFFVQFKPRVKPNYVATFLPIAEGQLRLAGERLAEMLNSTLTAETAPR